MKLLFSGCWAHKEVKKGRHVRKVIKKATRHLHPVKLSTLHYIITTADQKWVCLNMKNLSPLHYDLDYQRGKHIPVNLKFFILNKLHYSCRFSEIIKGKIFYYFYRWRELCQ